MAGSLATHRRSLIIVVVLYSAALTFYCAPSLIHRQSCQKWPGTAAPEDLSNPNAQQNISSEFPRRIWQTAKTGPLALEQNAQGAVRSWLDMNQEHRYELITDGGTASYVQEHFSHKPELLHDFLSLQDGLLRADLLRYLLLFAEGGTYTDVDTICLKTISQWVPEEIKSKVNLVFGVEGDSLGGGLIPGFTYPVQFASWTFLAKPRHMIMGMIIDRVLHQLRGLAKAQNTTIGHIEASYMDVMDTTGPGVFADSIYHGLSLITGTNVTSSNLTGMTEPRLFGDVLILPVTAFGAGLAHSNAGPTTDEHALVQHIFAGSWKAGHPMKQPEVVPDITDPQTAEELDADRQGISRKGHIPAEQAHEAGGVKLEQAKEHGSQKEITNDLKREDR
ncbi:MAG: hypothetical protein Q9191_003340 [Dirinaria sp. TL-2023a]